MKQQSITDGLTVYKASSFMQRLRGLLARKQLSDVEALYIEPCSDVHSFGMKYALDIVFLNNAGEIVKAGLLKPNRWMTCRDAQSVIELKAGCAEGHGLTVGQVVTEKNYVSIGVRHEK